MRRYHLELNTVEEVRNMGMEYVRKTTPVMKASSTGEWVLWEEVEARLRELEDRIPEVRIARLEKALGLVSQGRCPECGEKTAGWKGPSGYFGPEMAQSLRETGIDIGTGHKVNCSRRHEKH